MPAVDLFGLDEGTARLVVVVEEDDQSLLRNTDFLWIAAYFEAMLMENLNLVCKILLSDRQVVPDVGSPGGDAKKHALAAAADQDGRAARRFGLAHCIGEVHRRAFQRHRGLGPQAHEGFGHLVEGTQAPGDRGKLDAVGFELHCEPSGSEAADRATACNVVDRRNLFRQNTGVSEERRRDEGAEFRSLGNGGDRCKLAPCFENRQIGHGDAVEVVGDPQRVEPESIELDCSRLDLVPSALDLWQCHTKVNGLGH